MVADDMQVSISCGIAQFQEGDDAKALLSRADSALYSARAAGGNKQFVHSGGQIRERRHEPTAGDRPAPPPEMPVATAPVAASPALQLLATSDVTSQ
jgi:hypothetical protein